VSRRLASLRRPWAKAASSTIVIFVRLCCYLIALVLCSQACGGAAKRTADSSPDAGLDATGPKRDGSTPPDGDGASLLDAGPGGDAANDTGVPTGPDEADRRLFDPFIDLPRIDLQVTPAAELSLRNMPTEYAPATFTFTDAQGKVGPLDVAVRRKGYAGSVRSFDQKFAFKIDINALTKGQKFFGLKKLSLNNMVQDSSAVHEWVTYQLFASQGVPAPRVGYVRVFVNGVQFGVYLSVEALDDNVYLKRNFPSTLVEYEGEYSQDLVVGTEAGFDEDAGDDPERIALKALTQALAAAPDDKVYEQVASYLHWPEVLAAMATETVLGHWDGYAVSRNNYAIHFDKDRRASLLPWGTDQTLSRELPYFEGEGLLLRRCLTDPACKADYVRALASIGEAAQDFVDKRGSQLMTLASRLAEELATDPRVESTPQEIPSHAAEVLAFLSKRASDIRALLVCRANPDADMDRDGRICVEDCDETDATRYRGAEELCGDGVDQDCSGLLDDGPCPACAPDSLPFGDYLFCRGEVDYAAARTECAAHGATLVKLESAAQSTALTTRARAFMGEASWWLGLDDIATESEWVWSDASPAGTADAISQVYDCDAAQTGDHYCNWADEQPDNVGDEDCAYVRSGGSWNDLNCSYTLPFICQVP